MCCFSTHWTSHGESLTTRNNVLIIHLILPFFSSSSKHAFSFFFASLLHSPRAIHLGARERPSPCIGTDSWHLVTCTIYWINIDVGIINHSLPGLSEGCVEAQKFPSRSHLRDVEKLFFPSDLTNGFNSALDGRKNCIQMQSHHSKAGREGEMSCAGSASEKKDQLIFRCQKSLIFLRFPFVHSVYVFFLGVKVAPSGFDTGGRRKSRKSSCDTPFAGRRERYRKRDKLVPNNSNSFSVMTILSAVVWRDRFGSVHKL